MKQLKNYIKSNLIKENINNFFNNTELFELKEIEDIVKKSFDLFREQLKFENISVILEDKTIDLSRKYFSSEDEYFFANIRRFEENGILQFSEHKKELVLLPDWEGPNKSKITYAILNIKFNKDAVATMIASIDRPPELIKENEMTILVFYGKFLLELCIKRLLLQENNKLRKQLTFINKKIISQSKISTFGSIADIGINNIMTTMSVIDAHYKFIETGLGDKSQRDEIIRKEFNKARSELMTLIKISEETNSADTEIIDLAFFADNFIKIAKHLLDKYNIKFRFDMDTGSATILSNASLLYYIFFNIMQNAIDSMPDGGTFVLGIYIKEKNIDIMFVDSGVGLDEEELKKIYVPFYSGSESYRKMGISLYIIKNMLQQLSGKMDIISQTGKGTTVKLIFKKYISEEENGMYI